MTRDTIVFHVNQQHSNHLAAALDEAEMLRMYISGTPLASKPDEYWYLPKAPRKRIKFTAIESQYRCHKLIWPAALNAVSRFVVSDKYRYELQHRIFHRFDELCARTVLQIRPRIVVAYENSARNTFQAARSIGAKCVLDAPSIHWRTAESLIGRSPSGFYDNVNHRKDDEVDLADYVISCSQFAARSYIDAGVPRAKIVPILLGATPPETINSGLGSSSSVLRVIFAGVPSFRKGFDLLLEAIARINSESTRVNLVVVGSYDDRGLESRSIFTRGVTNLGKLSQDDLYSEIVKSDCLVLPSRFDSFGMVVAEALSVGVPAIVTKNVGASELMSNTKLDSLLVEVNSESIQSKFQEFVDHPDRLYDLKRVATEVGLKATWDEYRTKVRNFFQDAFGGSHARSLDAES